MSTSSNDKQARARWQVILEQVPCLGPEARVRGHLLDVIKAFCACVGDGLNEDELTRLLQVAALPPEAGFGFVSLSGGFVTLSVPPQDLAHWHPETGWIVPEKERVASGIAERYGLFLHEPPDVNSSYLDPGSESTRPRHHLEFSDHRDAVVIAHPSFLKVRLFTTPTDNPEFLAALAALYQVNPRF